MTGFKVMSWNVENLFQPGGEVSPGKVMQASTYEAKLEYLAGVVSDALPRARAVVVEETLWRACGRPSRRR